MTKKDAEEIMRFWRMFWPKGKEELPEVVYRAWLMCEGIVEPEPEPEPKPGVGTYLIIAGVIAALLLYGWHVQHPRCGDAETVAALQEFNQHHPLPNDQLGVPQLCSDPRTRAVADFLEHYQREPR